MSVSIRRLFRGYYKYCECNCGELIPCINKLGNLARFKFGHQNRGQNHSRWNNGRQKRDNYWYVWVPEESNMNIGEYKREHVYFYEQYHKCCMLPWGDIHHIEPVTKDYCNNMPWNLQGMMKQEHTRINMIGNQYAKEDMSGRLCIICGNSHKKWYGNKIDGWTCKNCYMKEYDKTRPKRTRKTNY